MLPSVRDVQASRVPTQDRVGALNLVEAVEENAGADLAEGVGTHGDEAQPQEARENLAGCAKLSGVITPFQLLS